MTQTDAQEEKLLDAEAWADELDEWSRSRRGTQEASETSALARLIRALVKSVRLSIVADGDPEDRQYLLEELESTMHQAQTLAAGSAPERLPPASGGGLPATLMRAQSVDLPAARQQRISDLPMPATGRPRRDDD